jgi:hypothetical protein
MADTLNTDPGTSDPDELYAALIEAHQGLSHEESAVLNAKLVLLLANHVDDVGVLRQAIRAAREPE